MKQAAEVAAPEVAVPALRALLRARAEEEVVGILLDLVRDLGARAEPPRVGDDAQLPLDLTFGLGDPLVPGSDDRQLLDALAGILPGLVEDARVALDRTRREAHLATSASTDVLTGLANRRTTMRVLSRLTAGDAVAMVDLDHFKNVNDTLGHDAGDAVLRAFARALRLGSRAGDTVGRIGGEEFVVLLTRSDVKQSKRMLARVRDAWLDVRPHPVTFSAGVAAIAPGEQPDAALGRADVALYAAKHGGRDRVEVAG